jgi:hypothetical protein
MDRRRFLSVAAAGGAILAARPRWAKGAPRALRPVNALNLTDGTRVERWTIVEVGTVEGGGVAVSMATESGERFQVDVLARDDAAPGVARTASLDLYLCNQGDGHKRSDEEQGLGAMALARALEGVSVPGLLTLRERSARFAGGAFVLK